MLRTAQGKIIIDLYRVKAEDEAKAGGGATAAASGVEGVPKAAGPVLVKEPSDGADAEGGGARRVHHADGRAQQPRDQLQHRLLRARKEVQACAAGPLT